MKHLHTQAITLAFLFFLALGAGCNRSSAPPTPLTLEELPGALDKAFVKAKPEAKDQAAAVVALLRVPDYPNAYLGLQSLAGKPGLTKEQINVTVRGSLTINSMLQSAQTQGDQKAAQTLKYIHDTK